MDRTVDILLVDDRPDGLVALEAVLAAPHLNLVKANSGFEALEELEDHDFAVILLDVQMPGIDGFETARRIKMMEKYRYVPIIFVTAINKDEEYVYRGYTYGAVDYVFKPFDARILRSKVSIFVDLHRKNRQLEEQSEALRESERRERYLRLAELEVESLKRYRNLADSIPHVVWRAKPDGTMDYFNRVWIEETGLTEEASLGNGWQSAFDPEDLRLMLKRWVKALDTGDKFEAEARIMMKDGSWRWHWIQGVAERRMNTDVIAWLGTCTDIDERKRAGEALLEAQQVAEAANQAKTSFLANMSHEIRTPLNSILGFTELMMMPDLSGADRFSSLVTVKRNGQQLLKIIDEILDISKVEANRLEVEAIEVDLRQMFAELQSNFELQARDKGLRFLIACQNGIPSRVMTDPTRMKQILHNLVGNAIKFTAEGEVEVRVQWQPGHDGKGKLQCFVRDTGVGIDAESAAKLFQPFTQADSSTTRKYGGTGLGLALARKLARALGGDVLLDSSHKAGGSVFRVDLAVDVIPYSGFWEYSDRVDPKESGIEKTDRAQRLFGIKVLVVDDACDNRTLMSRFLTGAGAEVACAEHGREGVDKALAGSFDVILMDIQMPILDGYAATQELRNNGYDRPIIALTAHALKEERERSLSAGCDDHLTKPIDRNTLITQVLKCSSRVVPQPMLALVAQGATVEH
ncbi:MAG: response regulator [Bdellovibrionota bacterium]